MEKLKSYYVDNRGMFLRPFSFYGRIGRKEYAIAFFIYFVLTLIIRFSTEDIEDGSSLFALGLLQLGAYIFFLCEAVKRCHDRNNPGIYILIPFYAIYLLFGAGDEGMNDYGDSPKAPKCEDEGEYVPEGGLEETEKEKPFGDLSSGWNIMGGSATPEILEDEESEE